MILTIIILFVYILIATFGSQYITDASHFFSKSYTKVLKGLCCIIVIFVHIPVEHGNKVQDAIGSFAYICVTLFFMISAYGLKWSTINKKNYIDNFFRNRICVLMIPYCIVFTLKYICGLARNIISKDFILLFLIFYLVFYFSHKYLDKKYQTLTICIFVILYSLLGRLFNNGLGWYTESLGFMYGIIFADIIPTFKAKLEKHYIKKAVILFIASIVFGIMYLKLKHIRFTGDYFLKIALGLLIIMLLFIITYRIKVGNKVNRYLGKISYEVYLTHELVIYILNHVNLYISSGVYILIVISGTIMLSSILNIIDVRIANIIRLSDSNGEKFLVLKE